MLWMRKANIGGRLEVIISILAVLAAIATFIAMSRKDAPYEVTSGRTMTALLYLNLVLLLALGASVGRWFVRIWIARKSGEAGSKLQGRITGVFTAVAMVPPIIMAIFSFLFLEFGIQTWFSEKVRTTINSSMEVAEAYLIEHRATIEKDMLAISIAYGNLNAIQQANDQALQRVADGALSTRLLSEVMLIEESAGEGAIRAHASQSLELRTSRIQDDMMNRVRNGETVIASNTADNTVIAMTRLTSFLRPTYLYVARDLDPQVLGYLSATRSAVADYETLEVQRTDVQLQFTVVFILISLLILLAAIWVGLVFSSRLVTPLKDLVNASERVGEGDLQARVPALATSDEVGTLSRAFNKMTDQIARHQNALVAANVEMDERRRFLEEVLESVSAGIIGLNASGEVYLPNKSALKMLGIRYEDLMHQPLREKLPAFNDVLTTAEDSESGTAEGQLQLDVRGENRTLLVRVTAEREAPGHIASYVVTFDDLTEQMADQRTAAWADVARRIAHEIKNPLTPIQLSAERLKRKYLKEIASDPKIFSQCTDTIIRQVGDLRRMVDEFSSFARMPAPLMKEADLVDLVRQSVFLQNVAAPEIRFTTDLQEGAETLLCDSRLIGQALTNVLKNASESVRSRLEKDRDSGLDTMEAGSIHVTVKKDDNVTKIIVQDNGIGLPQDQKDRLMEPYVTTRQKGTGLGLAIVRRIVEEHGGTIRIADRSPLGARAIMAFNHEALQKRADKISNEEESNTVGRQNKSDDRSAAE